MRISTAIRPSVLLALAAASLGMGCAGTTAPAAHATFDADAIMGAHYAAVLDQALDGYEEEVTDAAGTWYATAGQAWDAAEPLIRPNFSARVDAALASQGLRRSGLDAYSESHPEWLAEQNARFERRMNDIQPLAYHVLRRVRPDRARLPVPGDLPEPMPGTAVAAR
ncbi:MAG: hypothetical protein AAGH15_20025 [Myxococcota bacterium]